MKPFTIRGDAYAVAAEYEKEYGGRVCVIAKHLYDGIPQSLIDMMLHAGILCFTETRDGHFDASDPARAANLIMHEINDGHLSGAFAAALDAALRFYRPLNSSFIYSMSVPAFYLEKFKTLTGRYPLHVFEAGFGEDHRPMLLAAAMRGVSWGGVSPAAAPAFNDNVVRSIMKNLAPDVDIEGHADEVVYGKMFEDVVPRVVPDLIYSHATLEHVDNPRGFFKKAARTLAPDGLFLSMVDLTDHRVGEKPYEFLRIDNAAWPDVCRKAGSCVALHRFRHEDYMEAMRGAGLHVEFEVIHRMDVPPDLPPRYPGKTLEYSCVFYIGRREAK